MGSVNAFGGAPTYEHMRVLLKSLFDAKLEKFAITEPYQVVGVFPIGAEYLHVRDQAMNSVEALAGKKVSVMDSDPSEVVMMQTMGLQATGASIANFVRPFNSGEVDALVAPAMVYAPYEVQRGLGDKGGIYRTPVTQMVASLIINRESLKKKTTDLDSRVAAFHAITAEFLDQLLDRNLVTIERTEKEIPKKYWMTLEPENEKKFQEALRTTRMQMTKDGVYDARMMKLLKKVRCKIEPTAAECALTDESCLTLSFAVRGREVHLSLILFLRDGVRERAHSTNISFGKTQVNVEPTLGLELIFKIALCCNKTCLTIAKPSPVPPVAELRAASTR